MSGKRRPSQIYLEFTSPGPGLIKRNYVLFTISLCVYMYTHRHVYAHVDIYYSLYPSIFLSQSMYPHISVSMTTFNHPAQSRPGMLGLGVAEYSFSVNFVNHCHRYIPGNPGPVKCLLCGDSVTSWQCRQPCFAERWHQSPGARGRRLPLAGSVAAQQPARPAITHKLHAQASGLCMST